MRNTTPPSSEQDFYRLQDSLDRRWGWGLNCALFLHLLLAGAALYLPGILEREPLLDQVMTVDLVTLPEPRVDQPPEPAVPPRAAPKPAPKPETVAPQPEPEPVVATEPEVGTEQVESEEVEVKPVSLRPRGRKIRKARDTRLAEEKARARQAARLKEEARKQRLARQRALARARAEEKRAQEAARRARAELAAMLREQASLGRTGSGSRGSRQVSSALEKQYYMNLASRIQQLWVSRWPGGREIPCLIGLPGKA